MLKGNDEKGTVSRSAKMRQKLRDAVIEDIAEYGISRTTHRSVAKRANVSLASTTYYYETKTDMIKDASFVLAKTHLENINSLSRRRRSDPAFVTNFRDFCVRSIAAGLSDKLKSQTIAWQEIMIAAARDENLRSVAIQWFDGLEKIWLEVAEGLSEEVDEALIRSALDCATGQIFLAQQFGFSSEDVFKLLDYGMDVVERIDNIGRDNNNLLTPPEVKSGKKALATRSKIIDAAITLIEEGGVANVTHRAIAAKAGLAPTAPVYYYKTLGSLLQATQVQIFARAKQRYRSVMAGIDYDALTVDQLADLTSAVFMREVTEFKAVNMAEFSVYMDFQRNPALEPVMRDVSLDQHRAWDRLLKKIGDQSRSLDAYLIYGLFIGKKLRILATGVRTSDLGRVRLEFCQDLAAMSQGRYLI